MRRTFRHALVCALVCVSLYGAIAEKLLSQEKSDAGTRQYAAAVGLQNQNLYELAAVEWQELIDKYPNDPRVGQAWHYLGTCWLQQTQFAKAAEAFNTVVTRYPTIELVDASQLNLGIAQYGLAQKSALAEDYQRAGRAFASFVERFPRSQHLARALFYQGECLFHQGEDARAAELYQRVIQQHADSPFAADAYYALGVTQERLKQPDAAAATYDTLLAEFPKYKLIPEVQMRRAEIHFANEEYAVAESLFAALAKLDDFSLAELAMLRQARCLYEAGKYLEAGNLYWELPRQKKETKYYVTAILAGSKCYYRAGKFPAARSGLTIVAKQDGDDAAEASQWLGRAWLSEQQPQKALDVLGPALKRHRQSKFFPDLCLVHADALYEIPERRTDALQAYAEFAEQYASHSMAGQTQYMAALTALGLHRHDDARRYSEAFLAKHSGDALAPDVRLINAESRILLGDYAGAANQYREFLAAAPQHASAELALVRLGLALQLQKKYSEAIAWLAPKVEGLKDAKIQAEALLILGRSFAATGKPGDAVTALERSLKVDPNQEHTDETMLALAEALHQQGNIDQAIGTLQSMAQKHPHSPHLDEAFYRMGEYAYQRGRLDDAVTHYRRVTADWPKGSYAPHALYGIGWSQFGNDEYAATVATMSQLIDTHPQAIVSQRAYYVRAMAQQQLGEHQQAIADLKEFLKTDPSRTDRLDAQYVLAVCQAGLGRHQQAVDTFRKILKADPTYASADKVTYELGWSLRELGQTVEAKDAFAELATKYPDSPLAAESMFRVGETLYEDKEFDKAATAYLQAEQKAGPSDLAEQALHKLGWCALRQERYAQATEIFSRQTEKYPQGKFATDAIFLTGECAFQQEKWKTALPWFEKAIATKSDRHAAMARFRVGQCAGSLGAWDASITHYNALLKEFPDFEQRPEARYGIGWALQSQENYDQAVAAYEQVTRETQSETAAKARFMIGECYFAQRQHKEAIRHFLKAAYSYRHSEWSPQGFFEAARCFEVMNQIDQARNSYQQIVDNYPNHAKAAEAQRRLAEL